MAEDYSVLLGVELNKSDLDKVDKQIKELGSNLVTVKFADANINALAESMRKGIEQGLGNIKVDLISGLKEQSPKVNNEVDKIAKEIQNQFNKNPINPFVSNDKAQRFLVGIDEALNNEAELLDRAKNHFQEYGDVSVSVSKTLQGAFGAIVVKVENTQGAIQELRYELDILDDALTGKEYYFYKFDKTDAYEVVSQTKDMVSQINKETEKIKPIDKRLTGEERLGLRIRGEIQEVVAQDGEEDIDNVEMAVKGLEDERDIIAVVQDHFAKLNESGERFGEVTTRIMRNSANEITSFVVSLKNAQNETESMLYSLEAIKDENDQVIGSEYKYTGSQSSDNFIKKQERATKEAEKARQQAIIQTDHNKAAQDKLNASLNKYYDIQNQSLKINVSKPIQDEEHLQSLTAQAQTAALAIQQLDNATKENYNSLKANAEKEITVLGQLFTEYQRAEYVANQLRTKSIDVIKQEQINDVDAFNAKIERSGVVIKEFQSELLRANNIKTIDDLKKAALGIENNPESLRKFLDMFSVAKTEINAQTEAEKARQQAIKETEKDYNNLIRSIEKLGQLKAKKIGLDTTEDQDEIKKVEIEIESLQNVISRLRGKLNQDGLLTFEQISEISKAWEKAALVESQAQKDSNKKNADTVRLESYKELETIVKRIVDLEKRLAKVPNSEENVDLIQELNRQLNTAQTEFKDLLVLYKDFLDPTDIQKFASEFQAAEDKLRIIDEQIAALKSKASINIKTNLTNGNLKNSVDEIEGRFVKLDTESEVVNTNFRTLRNLLTEIENSDDIDTVISKFNQFKSILSQTSNEVKRLKREQDKQKADMKLSADKTALYSQIDVWLKRNSAATKQFGAEIERLKSEIKSADKMRLTQLKKEWQELKRQAELAGKATQNFGDQLKGKLMSLTTYFSASMMIAYAVRSLRSMYENVLAVDTAMTGLYRVTDLSKQKYGELYDQMTASAKKYGVALNDIINSTADWVRYGFDTEVSAKLAEITTMYQHVTDLDNSTATQNLLTAYKGFQSSLDKVYNNDQVEAITHISDVYDRLNNNLPVTASQIAEGVNKWASVAQEAGASFEEASALVVGGGSITQDFDAMGTALKTTTMRIRGMKGELQALGEEVDEDIVSTSKMQTQILNLTHGKVNIFEQDGKTFRNIYNVFKDIAKVWDSLSDTESAELLELIAGKNRANSIQSMITGWSEVEKAIKESANAAGTSQEEQERYMNSIKGKTDALQASVQDLSNTILSADWVKFGVDFLNGVVSALSNIIDGLGTVNSIVVSGAIIAFIKNLNKLADIGQVATALKAVSKAGSGIEAVSAAVSGLSTANMAAVISTSALTKEEQIRILMDAGLKKAEAEAALATAAHNAQIKQQSGLTSKLSSGFSGLFATIKAHPFIAIATAAITVIGLISNAVKQAHEEAVKRAQEAAEEAKKFKESLEDIDEYKVKINELVDAINDDNTSQSDALSKRKELLKIQEELIKKYGLEKEVVEGITGALEGEKNALDGVTKSFAKDYLDKHRQEIANAEKFLNETQDFYVKWNGKDSTGAVTVHTQDDFDRSYEHGWTNLSQYGSWEQYQLEPTYLIRQWMQETGKAFFKEGTFGSDAFQIHFKGTQGEILKSYKEFRSYIEEFIKNNNNRLSDEQKKLYDELLTNISNAINYIDNGDNNDNRYNNEKAVVQNAAKLAVIFDDNLSKLYDSYQESQEKYKEAVAQGNQDLINQAYQDVNSAYAELLNSITANVNGVQQATIQDWIKSLQEEFNKATDNTPLIVDVKAELDTDGSTVNKIIEDINSRGLSQTEIQTILVNGKQNPDMLSSEDRALWESIDQYIETYNFVARYMGLAEKSVEDFIEALLQLGLVQKDVANQERGDFGISKYRDSLDSLSDSLSKLKSARDKYMKGTLSDEELFKLIYDKDNGFPELANYINDIGTGLKVIADSKVDEVLKELEEVDVDGLTPKGLETYNRLINYLKDIKSGFDDASAAQEKFRSAMSETSSTIKTLVSMREEIEKNGKLSRDSVLTLLSDDKYRSVWNSLVDNNIAGYTKAINDLIKKEEREFNALAKNILRSESDNAVREKKQEIDEFEKLYEIDLSNWDNLSDDKKSILVDTNAELLARQKRLIDDFNSQYDTDITNFKNAQDAKEQILRDFYKSKAYREAIDLIGDNISSNNGVIRLTMSSEDPNMSKLQTLLSKNGLSLNDVVYYMNYGTLPMDTQSRIGNNINNVFSGIDDSLRDALSGFDLSNFLDDKSQSTTSETKQTLDWIERRLKKFAQTTKEVYADVEKYTDFTSKNSQLNKSISAVKNEIQANTDAYNAYMSAANAVSLDESYKNKVRNGTLNIETIKDSDLREKISQYQDLYDKAQSCKDTIESLKKTEKEYASQQLSNIEKFYSNRQKQAQNNLSYYNSADTDNLYIVKNYNGIRDSYNQQIQEVNAEAAQLRSTLNDLTSRGLIDTDEWYEWNDKIVQCDLSVKNLKKSLRDLADEELNDILNKWENRNSILEDENNYLSAIADDSFQKKNKNYVGLRSNLYQQVKNEETAVSELQNRLNQAVANGEFEKFSKKWYEWTNKINDSKENIVKLKQSVHELYVEELNDIKNLHDNNIAFMDSELEMLSQLNDNHSKKEKYYEVELDYLNKSYDLTKKKRKEFVDERAKVASAFKTAKKQGLEEGSEAWNQFESTLNDIDIEILKLDGDLKEFSNSIRDLPVNKIEHILDVVGKIRDIIQSVQSLHEAQGLDRTAKEIYDSINASGVEMQKKIEERDLILQKMRNGEYGGIESAEYQEAESTLLDLMKSIYDYQTEQEQEYDKLIDLSIDRLNKQKEEMQKQNSELEKRLSLEKAILALEKAKYQKNKLVYHEGVGFVYEADQNAIRDAQEQLDNQYYQSVLDYFDKVIDYLNESKKTHNIYDYAGNNITDEAITDNNIAFDPSKFTNINPESDYLYNNMKYYLDPEVAKMYESLFANMAVPQEFYDATMDIAKSAEVISSNFKNVQTPNNVQLTISKDAINLYGVNDPNSLAKAIINEFPTQFIQSLNRKN